ncbi:MAG: hypothetical protein ACK4NC_03890 [Candidatus Gracilibacteria bacterium]
MQQKKLKKRLLSGEDAIVGILYFFTLEGIQVIHDYKQNLINFIDQIQKIERYKYILDPAIYLQDTENAWDKVLSKGFINNTPQGEYIVSTSLGIAYENMRRNVYRYKRKLLKEIAAQLKEEMLSVRQQSAA